MLDYQPRDSSLPGQFVAGTVRCRDSSFLHIGITGSVRQCVDLSPRAVARVDRDFDYNPGN